MSGAQIVQDVAAALREAGVTAGNGMLIASLTPSAIGANPWDSTSALEAVDVVIVVDQFKSSEIDGARILSGDKKLLMEAGPIVPKPSDTIVVEGVIHRIEMVWPLAPAGVDLMYIAQARRV